MLFKVSSNLSHFMILWFSLISLNYSADLLNFFLSSIQVFCHGIQLNFKEYLSLHLNFSSHLFQLLEDSIVLKIFQQLNPLPLVQDNSTIIFNKNRFFFFRFSFLLANHVGQVWCICKILPFGNQSDVSFFNKNLAKQILYFLFPVSSYSVLCKLKVLKVLKVFFLTH